MIYPYAKTVDSGANWSVNEIFSGAAKHMAVWFDQETPGDSGTLIHIAWLDTVGVDYCYYMNLDTSDDSTSTAAEVDNAITVAATQYQSRICITKTISGNIIIGFETQTEILCYKSDDYFATAPTQIDDVYEAASNEDWCMLFPADGTGTGDNNDAVAIFWSRAASEITIKMYDDSIDTLG